MLGLVAGVAFYPLYHQIIVLNSPYAWPSRWCSILPLPIPPANSTKTHHMLGLVAVVVVSCGHLIHVQGAQVQGRNRP